MSTVKVSVIVLLLRMSKGSSQKFSVVPETNIVHFVLGPPPLPLKRTQLAMLDDENRMHVHVICTVSVDLRFWLAPPPPQTNHVRFRDDKKLLRRPLSSLVIDHFTIARGLRTFSSTWKKSEMKEAKHWDSNTNYQILSQRTWGTYYK